MGNGPLALCPEVGWCASAFCGLSCFPLLQLNWLRPNALDEMTPLSCIIM